MEDARIVQLYWDRNETAISESAMKYGPYCTSIAQNILRNPSDAEECVNDTWLHAWNAMPPHRPPLLSTFLGKITRNISFDLYKKMHREKRGGGQIDVVLDELADQYYASAFRGTPGSKEMDQALQTWTDDNTGGLLKEYTKDMEIAPDTVFELVSTIYYKAMWRETFWESNTVRETFHGTAGDTEVDMMKKSDHMDVYQESNFTAVGQSLQDSGSMYFLLPDENTDVNELVSEPDLLQVIQNTENSDNWSSHLVNLSVPKFKVSEKTDLLEALRALGVTDALDADLANFTPLTGDKENLCLSKADHAAMLEIDENGVTGAAYTELAVSETAAEIPDDEIDFTLDRPFLFLVTGQDGSLLFSGVVRNIDEE